MAASQMTNISPTDVEHPQLPPSKRIKLHGRAFYESIGSPKRIVAPMVDASELVHFTRLLVMQTSE